MCKISVQKQRESIHPYLIRPIILKKGVLKYPFGPIQSAGKKKGTKILQHDNTAMLENWR